MSKLKNSKFRCQKYRKKILEISQTVPALHIGGAFSSIEIVDSIYNLFMKKKDKFILSKGHAGILQYVVLNDLGIIKDKDLKKRQKLLADYKQQISKLKNKLKDDVEKEEDEKSIE